MTKPWVGVSGAHRRLVERIETIAVTDAEVLITGPSGVGKEYYARHVHDSSRRANAPFVAVNCGSTPDELFENELFGHVSGAFTGARPRSDGLVAAAESGTLFLDEIDTLSPRNQVKLLRFVQEKQYRRLENCVHYLTCLRLSRPVDASDLTLLDAPRPAAVARSSETIEIPSNFRRAKAAVVDEFEQSVIRKALEAHGGNIARAARSIGKPRRAFFEQAATTVA